MSYLRMVIGTIVLSSATYLVAREDAFVKQITFEKGDTTYSINYSWNTYGCVLTKLVEEKSPTSSNKLFTEYIYDASTLLAINQFVWKNNWLQTERTDFEYTPDGTIQTTLVSQNNTLIPSKRIVDTQGNGVKSHREFEPVGNNWRETLSTISFGTQAEPDSIHLYAWRNNKLSLCFRVTTTRQPSGEVMSFETRSVNNDTTANMRTDYCYNAFGRATLETQYLSYSDQWSLWARIRRNYDGLELFNETLSEWNVIYWKDICKFAYATGELWKERSEQYMVTKHWRDFYSQLHEWDEEDKLISIANTYAFWGGDEGEPRTDWLSIITPQLSCNYWGNKATISYFQNDETTGNSSKETNFIICPNPSSSGLFYLYDNENTMGDWKIYTVTGQYILCGSLANTRLINLSAMPSGIYLLNISSGTTNETIKLFKN